MQFNTACDACGMGENVHCSRWRILRTEPSPTPLHCPLPPPQKHTQTHHTPPCRLEHSVLGTEAGTVRVQETSCHESHMM